MSIEEKWFSEVENIKKVFTEGDNLFVIHKGFKITKTPQGIFYIKDVRFRDMYSDLHLKDRKILEEFGFMRGVDLIAYRRDLMRKSSYIEKVNKYYSVKKKLSKKDPKYTKKLHNCIASIKRNKDLVFDYQVRINQFKIKYNGKDKEIEDQARVIEGFQEIKQAKEISPSKKSRV